MAVCQNCGAQNLEQARFCQTCGVQLVVAQTQETESLRGAPEYGSFWARVAAAIIDAIILSFATAILLGAANIAGGLASLFLPWIYEAAMVSSKKQATVGKIVLGLIVTDTTGRPISFARATGRHFAKYLSALILGIGFLMVAFTDRKQGLHDMIADTLVLKDKLNTI